MSDVKTLYVFDFDDTLVTSNELVHVTHSDGSVSSMTTHEYAMYHYAPGDESDFKEFEQHLDEPDVLPHYDTFLSAIDEVGPQNVVVLTARTYSDPPKRWLRHMGVNGVKVVALASTNAEPKKHWIKRAIEREGYERVFFFDDNPFNVTAVDSLKNVFPDKEIISLWVQ